MKPDKHTLLTYFRDFFTFHNENNRGYKGIDDLFEDWYRARIESIEDDIDLEHKCSSRESPDGRHHAEAYSSEPSEGFYCKFCRKQLS